MNGVKLIVTILLITIDSNYILLAKHWYKLTMPGSALAPMQQEGPHPRLVKPARKTEGLCCFELIRKHMKVEILRTGLGPSQTTN